MMMKSILAVGTVAAGLLGAAAQAGDSLVLEIAIFKLVPGTRDATMLDVSQQIQDRFLPRYDGRIYRELMKDEDSGYWIDSIHWESLGDFAKAAAGIYSDPEAAPLMRIIDPATTAWFHADRVVRWRARDVPDDSGFTELHLFRLVGEGAEVEFREPVTDAEFLRAAGAAQPFIAAQPGFADRELFHTEDGWWVDLIHWNSREAADAAASARAIEMADPGSAVADLAVKLDPKSVKIYRMQQQRVW